MAALDRITEAIEASGAALAALSELHERSNRTTGAEARALHSCGMPASPIECMPNRQSALSTASFSRQDATVRGIEMECTNAPSAGATRVRAREEKLSWVAHSGH